MIISCHFRTSFLYRERHNANNGNTPYAVAHEEVCKKVSRPSPYPIFEMLSALTLRDLCLSFIRITPTAEDRKLTLPSELIEEITYIKEVEEKELSKLVFGGGRVGLYRLLTNSNDGMCKAARDGDLALVKFFISKGASWWNKGLRKAAVGNHTHLVDFFIEKGADYWSTGMFGAARGGHLPLVEFFIEKGADDWDWGMCDAANDGHIELVLFFIGKGARDWDRVMNHVLANHQVGLIDFFVSKGAKPPDYLYP